MIGLTDNVARGIGIAAIAISLVNIWFGLRRLKRK